MAWYKSSSWNPSATGCIGAGFHLPGEFREPLIKEIEQQDLDERDGITEIGIAEIGTTEIGTTET